MVIIRCDDPKLIKKLEKSSIKHARFFVNEGMIVIIPGRLGVISGITDREYAVPQEDVSLSIDKMNEFFISSKEALSRLLDMSRFFDNEESEVITGFKKCCMYLFQYQHNYRELLKQMSKAPQRMSERDKNGGTR